MKLSLSLLFLVFCIAFCGQSSFAQKYTIDDFYKVDSLANAAKPKDALALIEIFNAQARTDQNAAILIKSVIYRMMLQSYLEENAFAKILVDLKKDISIAKQPAKSILQSLLAETYWKYYQQNRWRIAERTNLQGDIGDDITTWSIARLTKETSKLYLASLERTELLQKTKVDLLDGVLAGDKLNRKFRPTLYDLLAHRTIDAFTNTQFTLTQTDDENFDFNQPIWLAESQDFLKINLSKIDSTSFYAPALQIFKNLILFHTSAQNQTALTDVDLKRLKFVAQYSSNKELYFKALQSLATKSMETEIYADVLYEQALLHKNVELQVDTNKQNLVKATELAQKAINAHPKSVGSQNAENLLSQIRAKSLTIKMKQFILPNKPAQLYFSYTNVDTVYVKLYRRKLTLNSSEDFDSKERFLRFITSNKALKEWFVIVPKSNDYQNHSLVDKIEGLSIGNYVIIAQNTKTNDKTPVYSLATFGVTSIHVNTRIIGDTVRHFFVTNNLNGAPVKDVEITQSKTRYNANSIEGPTLSTDQFGFAEQKNDRSDYNNAMISYGKDSILLSLNNFNYYYRNYNEDEDDDDEKKVILFTDRPIYRPGQIIYYKGLLISKDPIKNKILPNEKLEVSFKDVNLKEIEKLEATTNEYGTFSGSFTIPMGKLNGTMLIRTDFGSLEVLVEEYKRPTFEIVFDKPNQRYKLNDSIKVQGKAASFSGYSISNAKVSYKIFRTVIYDYTLSYAKQLSRYGSSPFNRLQVAVGKAATNAEGKFDFTFFAKAPNNKINYSFAVEMEITDINGETRTKSTSLNVGEKDIQLTIATDQVLFLSAKPDSISFNVANLNGEPIKAKVKAEWSLLHVSTRLMNKSPFYAENYSLTKEEFIKTFPDDDYDDELELLKWPVKNLQHQQEFNAVNGRGELSYNSKDLIPGYYRIKLTAINMDNDTVTLNKYLIVNGKDPKRIETRLEMLVGEHTTIAPNESAIFRVAGLADDAIGYYEVYYKNTVVEKVWLNLSAKQTILKIKSPAHFEDGFAVQFNMVYKGTVYNFLEQVNIVDVKKQLDIKFLTFRDKLQPGENESWKLQISNRSGEKQMAEMVATLYDASLNDLKKMDWNSTINPVFNYDFYSWQYKTNELSNGSNLWFFNNNSYYPLVTRQYEGLNWFGYEYYGGYNSGYRNYLSRIQARPKKGITAEASKKLAELANGKIVYGVVFDNEGYAIPGVIIKVGKLSTTTNNFGVYGIDAKIGEELTVTFIGFENSKITIGKNKRVDITLKPDGKNLSEVVVTGYGSVRKETLAASMVSVVETRTTALGRTSDLLAKLPGLQVQSDGVIVEDKTTYNFISMEGYDPKTGMKMVNGKPVIKEQEISARTNFNESAFFYPNLLTDENGQITVNFTIPQSLTRYKMLGFAHTKDLKTATVSSELVTQKQLAISANAPRFFREGDTILFSAKLNNLSGKKLIGSASLEIRNALTGKVIQIIAIGNQPTKDFEINNGGNEVVKWPLIIPIGLNAISYKVVAQAGQFSDGEEMTIPVLPNAMLVTEAMPITVRSNVSKTFTLEKLMNSGSSKTMRNEALTFEFTANPIWYAIQALPYLMEYPYECAEQTFSRFYANSFATGIINSSPKIAAVFKQWQNTNNGEALLSNLEKNEQLKSILLEETPWVKNATNETQRKKRIAVLFDLNRMTYELKRNFEKLEKMQYNDGSFPWFAGMKGDRYITQHIVLGIGQLKKLKLIDEKAYPNVNSMLNKAVGYLDRQLINDYKVELAGKRFGYLPLHYLFARSYTNPINTNEEFLKAKDFYLKKIVADWKIFDSYQLGQAAIVLHRSGNKVEPAKIISLLKQTAQQNHEMGMYWSKNTSGWWWYQNPIETQSLLIEAFDEVANDLQSVEEMKIWLLKNKQTNDWKTTKATAAACYALLMKGYNLLSETVEPEILIGNKTIAELDSTYNPKEAGTGYQKIRISGANVKPEMGKVDVKNNNKTVAWGALYWQYFEQLDKITPANTGVKIKKQLFIQSSTNKGNLLTPITVKNILRPGDLLKVRIEIYSDREMEYVHLKDMRSSGFEPVNAISAYKYQDGLGYYESTKDASTNFFISHLPKGTYVFEYELRVTHAGNFSNGITSLQCMYAPDFTAHSEGIRVVVK